MHTVSKKFTNNTPITNYANTMTTTKTTAIISITIDNQTAHNGHQEKPQDIYNLI